MKKIIKDSKKCISLRVKSKILASNRKRIRLVKSNKYLKAFIYDEKDQVVYFISTRDIKNNSKVSFKNKEAVSNLADKIDSFCSSNGLKGLAFDRYHYKYHGNVKLFSEHLRESGVLI